MSFIEFATLMPLLKLAFTNAQTQGQTYFSEIKNLITSCPWYYYAAFSGCTIIYLVPKIMKKRADYIQDLRSERENLKKVWLSDSTAGTDHAAKVAQLEKRIEELEALYKNLEKLLDYHPAKRTILAIEASNVKFLSHN